MLGPQAVATEPFTDFSVDRVSRLSIRRTYSSADRDLQVVGTGGIFANAWHHNWEATLRCASGVCSVNRGLHGFKFGGGGVGTYLSLDGTESWNIYQPYAPPGYKPSHRNVLVQRPNDEWIVFLTDGTELHFQTVCTACDGSGPYCTPVLNGGTARLVKAVDPRGNSVHLSYDAFHGLLLGLTDDLGHSLELRSGGACYSSYATEMRYDGSVVARYTYGSNLLLGATDGDNNSLRSYVYANLGTYWPRLQAVLNAAGTAVAEFSYDSSLRAVGVVDTSSSVMVSYGANRLSAVVSEYFRGPQGDTSGSSQRTLDWNRRVTSVSDGCACGPPRTNVWTPSGQLACSTDISGRISFQEFDLLGRVTHRVQYTGQRCEVPSPMPADAIEEWRAYGVVKPIAQGVGLDLDAVTTLSRRSALSPGNLAQEISDYDQGPKSMDPPGYVCAASPLPAGSVLCRRISSGYVTGSLGPVVERHATFLSYDARGRLVRRYGPVNLDGPGPGDVPAIEERTYWGDGDTPERQGRLYQVKLYASPAAPPLVTSYDYDMFGVSRVTAPDGSQSMAIKDGGGRTTYLVSADPAGTVRARTETRYYDGNTPRLRILPSGAAERYSFDGKGRVRLKEYLSSDPEAPGANPSLAWSESYVYDQAGNVIHGERRDGQGHVTWQQDRAYDVQHRVVWESNPALPGAGRTWSYDAAGSLTATTDEEGRATVFTPDGLGRVQGVRRSGQDSLGNPAAADVASYQYAPNQGILSAVTDGSGRATAYTYDDFGRVERVSSPTLSRGGGVWYRYDAQGNVTARGDQSVSVTYAYDGLGRVTSVNAQNSSDGSVVSYQFTYDENGFTGRLTSVVDADRAIRYTYDWAGRLQTEVMSETGVGVPLTTAYGYDAVGALQQLSYPSGLTLQFDRDPATRQIVGVRNAADGTAYASTIARNPGGPIASLVFGNGRTLSQTFNMRYEPLAIHSGPLWLTYTPTPAGDIGVMADQSEDPSGCVLGSSRSFSYDFQDRMSRWSDAVQTGAGICPAEGLGDLAAAFTYVNGTDQIASQSAPDPSGPAVLAFGYDNQGNISAIGRYDSAGSSITSAVCLRHDALGRLVLLGSTGTTLAPGGTACVSDADVTSALARFKYDARNRRVARQVDNQWTYVVSDLAGRPLSEMALLSGAWTKVRDYVWLDGLLLAQVEYVGSSTYQYFAHVDHLGVPRALTNANGQVVWRSYQRPFAEIGEKMVADPLSGQAVVTNLRLPGQYDERVLGSIGLQGPYYNWNRWYLPGVGRYLELDPMALRGGMNGPHGPDWYNYSEGNPLTKTDFFGLDAEFCHRDMYGPLIILPGQHCFVRFNGDDKDTSSFDPGGVHPDPAPPWWPGRQCKPTDGPQDDDCVKKAMKKCKNYDFFGFNCCHCVEQAFKACGLSIPPGDWPNWPINPGPQPFEPGYNPRPK